MIICFIPITASNAEENNTNKRIFLKAEQGHAGAQINLGVMYVNGKGVPQDYTEALKWFRKAAEQGLAEAQFNLGVMYGNGEGVPQDYVESYAWTNIAAAQGNKDASKLRDALKIEFDPASLVKAQTKSKEYYEKYVVPFQ